MSSLVLVLACRGSESAGSGGTDSASESDSRTTSATGDSDAADTEMNGTGTDAGGTETSATTGDTSATGTGTTSDTGEPVDCAPPPEGPLTQVWAWTADQSDTVAGAFAVNDAGEVVVVGRTGSDLSAETWMRSLDGDGVEVWSESAIAPPQSGLEAVALAPGGQFHAVGSTLVEDPMFGLTTKLFVGAYDASGQSLWTDDTPTDPPNPFAQGVTAAVAPTGDLVVAGIAGSADGFLRCYDAAGNTKWSLSTPSVHDIAIDDTGTIFLAGSNGTDALMERRDDAGSVVWSEVGPGPGETNYFGGAARAVALGADGRPVFVGVIEFLVGNPMNPNDRWTELWVQRRDGGGTEVWTTRFDHTGFPQVSVAVHDDDTVTAVHRMMDESAFVRRLDASGAVSWETELACPNAWRMEAAGADIILSGRVDGAVPVAFVGRYAG